MILLLAVDQILRQRQGLRRKKQSRVMVIVAVALHAILLTAALILPELSARATPPKRVIQAQIVPLQALGIPDPPKAQPRKTPPPKEKPVPGVETPQPTPPPPSPPPPALRPEVPTPKPAAPRTESPTPVTRTPSPRESSKLPESLPTTPVQKGPEPVPVRAGSEKGSARGQSSFGAAVASLDNPDFTYGYYIDRMLAVIRSRWTRPAVPEGTETTLHFMILKNGTIEELEIRTPSGEPVFDRAALRAVGDSSPLPPLPVGYRRDSIGVTLVVE